MRTSSVVEELLPFDRLIINEFCPFREKLSLQYAIRIAENNSNPAHDVTFQPKYMDLHESKPNFIKSFGV